ncbi:MAG: Dihydrofolate reductase [Parcubacteria group bacterium Gr01-1014_18]|nr:MAG: Dihydrofolate reductase [Parcubacteria group bacterium Greene0416_36]TSC79781.1 MAG: Dihydrofolate reductase [Parcubacteria group bacterium Gr01-1014_18]TSC98065.1 MAG: Dihydrofolate reductase [Parcubacteria group bacterium Greene1014_20]
MKTLAIAAQSLDGYISPAAETSTMTWVSAEDKAFFRQFTRECGVVVMGRKTYDTIRKPLPDRLNIVMTCDPLKCESIPGVIEFTSSTPFEILKNLETRKFEKVAVIGGSGVYTSFAKENLIDELYLTIEPILFGRGIPMFQDLPTPPTLKLLEQRKLGTSSVLLHYKIATNPPQSPFDKGEAATPSLVKGRAGEGFVVSLPPNL